MAHKIHQYKRIKQEPSGRLIWRCMIANCNHYITPEFILGKYSICPVCQREFIIDKVAKDRTFPKCPDCRGLKESKGAVTISPSSSINSSVDILKKYGLLE